MNTPQMAEKPNKVADFVVNHILQLSVVAYLGIIVSITLMFSSGGAAMAEANGHTSILYGWNHGFYIIPGLVASMTSSEYSIYQTGGGALYNISFLAGVLFMLRLFRIMTKK